MDNLEVEIENVGELGEAARQRMSMYCRTLTDMAIADEATPDSEAAAEAR